MVGLSILSYYYPEITFQTRKPIHFFYIEKVKLQNKKLSKKIIENGNKLEKYEMKKNTVPSICIQLFVSLSFSMALFPSMIQTRRDGENVVKF